MRFSFSSARDHRASIPIRKVWSCATGLLMIDDDNGGDDNGRVEKSESQRSNVSMHSASGEEKSLKLVEDFNSELMDALDSLGSKKVNALLDTYRFWSSKHLQRAVDGFAFLRRAGRMDGSKFLVRPAIEMMIRLEVARQHPDLFYRIARSEHLQDKHLLRIAGNDPQLQAQSDKTWELFDNAFKKEFPKVLVPNVDDKPSIEYLADKAKLKPFYDSHYRIYSRYTHGAVHASTGNIDKATDRADNQIMAVCALVALDNLISLGAKSSNRDRLAQRLSGIS
jgi:Family of unknown function (DUF5677)